jgi:hypothetical protein
LVSQGEQECLSLAALVRLHYLGDL